MTCLKTETGVSAEVVTLEAGDTLTLEVGDIRTFSNGLIGSLLSPSGMRRNATMMYATIA